MGDLNINMHEQNQLQPLLDRQSIRNVVNKRFKHAEVLHVGLSDFHNMVCFATKMYVPVKRKRAIVTGVLNILVKKGNVDDLNQVPYHVSQIFDSAED